MHNHRIVKNPRVVVIDDPKMKIHYLLYSPSRGVYLGDGVFSYDEKAAFKHNSAHTYLVDEADRHIQTFAEKKGVEDVIKVEAHPDLTFNLCSVDAVANSGLPRWEYDTKKLPILEKFKLANLNNEADEAEEE